GDADAAVAGHPGELDLARGGGVVEQVVGAEVVVQHQLRQPVAVEVDGGGAEFPAGGDVRGQHRVEPGVPAVAQAAEEVVPAAVDRQGQRVVHLHAAVDRVVEDGAAVGEVVADEDVLPAVTVEVGDGGHVAVPQLPAVLGPAAVRHQLDGLERLRVQPGRLGPLQVQGRRPAPPVDE